MEKGSVLVKNFYKEHPNTTSRSEEANQEFIKNNKIIVKGINAPKPVFSFAESSLHKYLIDTLQI